MLKNENDFSDQRFIIRNREYSRKSVCINNHIKKIFIVLLTTDLRLSSI